MPNGQLPSAPAVVPQPAVLPPAPSVPGAPGAVPMPSPPRPGLPSVPAQTAAPVAYSRWLGRRNNPWASSRSTSEYLTSVHGLNPNAYVSRSPSAAVQTMNPFVLGLRMGVMGAGAGLTVGAVQQMIARQWEPGELAKPMLVGALVGGLLGGGAGWKARQFATGKSRRWSEFMQPWEKRFSIKTAEMEKQAILPLIVGALGLLGMGLSTRDAASAFGRASAEYDPMMRKRLYLAGAGHTALAGLSAVPGMGWLRAGAGAAGTATTAAKAAPWLSRLKNVGWGVGLPYGTLALDRLDPSEYASPKPFSYHRPPLPAAALAPPPQYGLRDLAKALLTKPVGTPK